MDDYLAADIDQTGKIGNDEVAINNVVVTKRKMYPTVDKTHILNGVELGFDVCFGNYQQVIDKNAYYLGDGKS
jgi:hypothetical protein